MPCRNERCVFVLRPVTHTVGDFVEMLRQEDAGIDRVVVRNHAGEQIIDSLAHLKKTVVSIIFKFSGVRIASTTVVQHLLEEPSFQLIINDRVFEAGLSTMARLRPSLTVQGMTGLPPDELQHVNDVKSFIGRLYEVYGCIRMQLDQVNA